MMGEREKRKRERAEGVGGRETVRERHKERKEMNGSMRIS